MLHRLFPRPLSSQAVALVGALAGFGLLILLGEAFLATQIRDYGTKQRMETLFFTSSLRARVERELNSMLYLNSGLASYLAVRHADLEAKEVNDILAVLHGSSRHVRNFGVAVGYQLRYVYPLRGNERAVGLDYRNLSEQWPVIRQIVETGKPVLAGPLNLVQGGRGLIYRVPITIEGRYWGLLSTVIDTDSLFRAIFSEAEDSRYRVAVRGKDGRGGVGDMVWGQAALFDEPDAHQQEIEVPGGRWVIAVKPQAGATAARLTWLARAFAWPLAALIAWMLYMLIRNRAEMAQLAMYDALTGLPNRNLLEDRVEQALARQRRRPGGHFVLLFLDLDGFKIVNDALGHKAGDTLLRTVAQRTRDTVRLSDTVARWGGDEFIVLMEDAPQQRLEPLLQRLREEIERPVEFEREPMTVGVSIGVARYPEDGTSMDALLKTADQRMYAEKTRHHAAH